MLNNYLESLIKNLTAKQKEAVLAKDINTIVSASAGSGKTFTLIRKLIYLIIKGDISVDSILALTFTNAAANEMKQRLKQALETEVNNKLLDKEVRKRIASEILLLETSLITTIHSFCLTIVKDFGYLESISSKQSQNNFDEGSLLVLKKQALETTFDKYFKLNDKSINLLLNEFVVNPSSLDKLENIIISISDTLKDFDNRQIKDLKKQISLMYNVSTLSEIDTQYVDEIYNYYSNKLYEIRLVINNELVNNGSLMKADYYQKCQGVVSDLDNSLKQIKEKDSNFYTNIVNIFKDFSAAKRNFVPKTDCDLYCDKVTSLINDLVSNYLPLDDLIATLNYEGEILLALIKLTEVYLENFAQVKKLNEGMDFDDYIYFARKIIKNHPEVREYLINKFEIIVVDEFQDTNYIQNEIVTLIAKDKQKNVFRVGDIKQSIYRFQGAKPQLMKSMIDNQDNNVIFLKNNFRSKIDIVESVNILFEKIMNVLNKNVFTKEDVAIIGLEREFNYPSETINLQEYQSHGVETLLYFAEGRGNLNYDRQLAILFANKIIELLKSDMTIDYVEKTIIDNKVYDIIKSRKLKLSDFTILIPSHNKKEAIREIFDLANIPHNIVSTKGFYQMDVIKDVIDILRYVVSKEDYYLSQSLLSIFINYSLDDLAALKIKDKEASLIDLVKTYDQENYQLLKDLENFKFKNVSEILIYLSNLNNTYNKLDKQRQANFDYLIKRALDYQNMFNPSILGFINYIDNLVVQDNYSFSLSDEFSEANLVSDDSDVVTIMTYHGSKGLEFPITLVWPYDSVKLQDKHNDIICDDKLAFTLKESVGKKYNIQKSIYRLISEDNLENDSIAEHIRLLYVALTRATHKLFIIDLLVSSKNSKMLEFEKPLDKFLIKNFKHTSQLINLGLSESVSMFEINLEDLKLDQLDEVAIKSVSEEVIVKDYPFERKSVESYQFEFNPNFMHAVNYGNLLHNAIETLEHKKWTLEDLKAYPSNIQNTLLAYNNHTFTLKLYEYNEIYHEMPVIYQDGENINQSIIDFYAIKDQEIVIVDFKSDNTDVKTLIQRYKQQILNYKTILQEIYSDYTITCYLYSFKHNDYIEVK